MRVVFVEPEEEGNLGFLARVMKNFGFKELVLVNPQCRVGEEALKRAMHAKDILENMRIADSFEEAVRGTYAVGTTGIKSGKHSQRRSVTPERFAKDNNADFSIVFGRESTGLSNEEIEKCNLVVRIENSLEYPIMNITHAASVIFYEVHKNRGKVGEFKINPEKFDFLEKTFKSIASKLDYSEKEHKKLISNLNKAFKKLLFEEEVENVIGFFRKIDKRLGEETW